MKMIVWKAPAPLCPLLKLLFGKPKTNKKRGG